MKHSVNSARSKRPICWKIHPQLCTCSFCNYIVLLKEWLTVQGCSLSLKKRTENWAKGAFAIQSHTSQQKRGANRTGCFTSSTHHPCNYPCPLQPLTTPAGTRNISISLKLEQGESYHQQMLWAHLHSSTAILHASELHCSGSAVSFRKLGPGFGTW